MTRRRKNYTPEDKMTILALPGETESGSAGEQPDKG